MLDEKRIWREGGRSAGLQLTPASPRLRLVEAPVHQRAHPLEQEATPESIASSASAVRYSRCSTSAPGISPASKVSDPVVACFEREITLPGPLRDRDHFVRVGEPL